VGGDNNIIKTGKINMPSTNLETQIHLDFPTNMPSEKPFLVLDTL
jgi:hypothetical protein